MIVRAARSEDNEKEPTMYVIAGATGHTGKIVAETLLAGGKPVRALVRDPAKAAALRARGAEVAVADLEDSAALARAFAGAAAAYVLIPPRPTSPRVLADQGRVLEALARAIEESRLPHVVLLSSHGAQHEAGTGPVRALHAAEVRLRATGAAVTALRAPYFMENWAASLGAVANGILPTFIAEGVTLAMAATPDIGRAAARLLVEGGAGSRIVELAGPRDYSSADVAAAVSAIAGRPIQPAYGSPEAIVPTFTGFGLSEDYARLFEEMYDAINRGHLAPEGKVVRGTVPIEDVLRPLL
jgi:uncharacterized protein YbjT (DUF2867 family)